MNPVANDEPSLEMAADEMRRFGYRVVDSIVEHAVGLREKRVLNVADREKMEALLREDAPEEGMAPAQVLEAFEEKVARWISYVDHPRTLAWIPGSGTFVGAMGDALASGYNIYAGTWVEACAATQLELVVTDWFRSWLGMPETAGGTLVSGGSVANLTALVLAREAWVKAGDRSKAVIYSSELAHSSVARGAFIAGFAPDQLRTVRSDGELRMLPDALVEAVDEDRGRGLTPFCVVANAGATTTGTVDRLLELADVCEAKGLWLHADAAYGGFAALDPRGREALAGIERADSVTLDPHKWLYTPFDCGCVLVREFERLRETFGVMPDYMVDTQMGGPDHPNLCDYGVQLSRAARALKIWMTLKHFGVRRVGQAISHAMDLARHAQGLLEAIPAIEVVTPVSLSTFTFRYVPNGLEGEAEIEALNRKLLGAIWDSGRALLSSSRVRGKYVIRFCVVNHNTRRADVEEVVQLIADLGAQLTTGQST